MAAIAASTIRSLAPPACTSSGPEGSIRSIRLYTDDRGKLLQSLERHAGEKTSAIEPAPQVQRQEQRPAVAQESPALRMERLLGQIDRRRLEAAARQRGLGREERISA